MTGLGANAAPGACFQIEPHRLIELALEKLEQLVSCFLVHRLTSSQFIQRKSKEGMHDLAEREKDQKKIRKEHMQNNHEGVTRHQHIVGDHGLELHQAHQVFPIIVRDQAVIFIPPSCPIHFASEDDGEEQQDQKIVIFWDRQLPVWRCETPEQEIQQANGQDQADDAVAQEYFMRDDLDEIELPNQLEMADNEKQEGDVEEHQKNPQNGIVFANGGQQKGVVQCP
jgi:hypothetical protein